VEDPQLPGRQGIPAARQVRAAQRGGGGRADRPHAAHPRQLRGERLITDSSSARLSKKSSHVVTLRHSNVCPACHPHVPPEVVCAMHADPILHRLWYPGVYVACLACAHLHTSSRMPDALFAHCLCILALHLHIQCKRHKTVTPLCFPLQVRYLKVSETRLHIFLWTVLLHAMPPDSHTQQCICICSNSHRPCDLVRIYSTAMSIR
jgi:hypothetical protein